MSSDQEQTRFRSFAERYVIERASGFKTDGDAWACIQDAARVYKMIAQQSVSVSETMREAAAPVGAGAMQSQGATQGGPAFPAVSDGVQRALQTAEQPLSLAMKLLKVLNI
jgi:hypothetical protein